MTSSLPWDLGSLMIPPRIFPAAEFSEPGIQALFYETLPWRGRPTTPVTCIAGTRTAEADLPAGVSSYYFNLTDERGLMVSSEYRTV